MASPDVRRPIWIFDSPRTCSQLLHRLFKGHPRLEARTAFQWATHAMIAGPERVQARIKIRQRAKEADEKLQAELVKIFPPETMDISVESYAVASERLTNAIEAAQAKGLIPYIKEHIACLLQPAILTELCLHGSIAQPITNPTTIADHLFRDIQQPLVLFRHPALVLPSFYRAQLVNFGHDPDEDAFQMWTMQRTPRYLFELLKDQGHDPLLVNAEDVVFRPEALCRKLCEIWKIEPEGLSFEWTASVPNERTSHPLGHYVNRLEDSTGVIRPEETKIDIDFEQAKWAKEFGQEVAFALKSRLDADMPDYLHMQQYRLRLED